MKLRFSTALRSQMDGKTERVNGILKQYLRNLVGVDQGDWADYVGRAEFSCNVAMHLATKGLSFMVAHGVDALQPTNLALEGAHSTLEFNQDGEDLEIEQKQVLEMTKLLVEKARRCYEV